MDFENYEHINCLMFKDQKRTIYITCSKAYRTVKINKAIVYITYEQLNHTFGM